MGRIIVDRKDKEQKERRECLSLYKPTVVKSLKVQKVTLTEGAKRAIRRLGA